MDNMIDLDNGTRDERITSSIPVPVSKTDRERWRSLTEQVKGLKGQNKVPSILRERIRGALDEVEAWVESQKKIGT